MTDAGFDAWLASLTEGGDPGELDPAWLGWLRQTYETSGALPVSDVNERSVPVRVATAQDAIPSVIADIESTTGTSAQLRVWQMEPPGPENSWALGLELEITGGGASLSPVDWGPDIESARVGLAEFVMEWVTEAVGWPWPVCPEDNYGLDPEVFNGQAVWRCRSPRHEVVAPVGALR